MVFEGLPRDDQLSVLQTLEFMAHQAHATRADVRAALARAEVERSFQPARAPDRDSDDILGQYRYLMALYSVADERRRIQCAGQCSHWWHYLDKA